MNYTKLKADVQQYLENYESSFVASIDGFIELAEERIYNSVQLPSLRKSTPLTMASGSQYLNLPADYLATFSIAAQNLSTLEWDFLLNKDVNFIREAYPKVATTGTPLHYAQFDADTFLLGPTPNQNYPVELHYYAYPESIVTASTSWLGDNFSDALLYGTIVEAYANMKGEKELMDEYKEKYKDAIAMLKRLGDGLDRRDAYRSGQARTSVG